MASRGFDPRSKHGQGDDFRPRNILDSTAPKPRGKERLIPKEKKPKTFRRIINYEKDDKKLTVGQMAIAREPDDHGNKTDKPGVTSADASVGDSKILATLDKDFLSDALTKIDLNDDLDSLVDLILHQPCHREYVHQALTNQVEYLTYSVLIKLIRFQDRVHHKNPEKLQTKRRYVCGFNQVAKHIRLNKTKAVIIAPDTQKVLPNGILDRTVNNLIASCNSKEIPIIFTSTRSRLAKVCCKPGSNISCIAILDYGGAQDEFHQVLQLIGEAKKTYQKSREALIRDLKKLTHSSLSEMARAIKETNQIPSNLHIYRETIYSPLQKNVYSYIKTIKQKN